MSNSKNLLKRGKNFYLRLKKGKRQFKVSLGTTDFYEAQFLRDRVMSEISEQMKGFKFDNSRLKKIFSPETFKKLQEINPDFSQWLELFGPEIYKDITARTLEMVNDEINGPAFAEAVAPSVLRSIEKCEGSIPESFFSDISLFVRSSFKIKDQTILESMLLNLIGSIEARKSMNGGVLPDDLLSEMLQMADSDGINSTPGSLINATCDLSDGRLQFNDLVKQKSFQIKDFTELRTAYNEAAYNVAVQYIRRHHSTPALREFQDDEQFLTQNNFLPSLSQIPTADVSTNSTITLKQLIEEYLEEKSVSDDAKQSTVDNAQQILKLAMEFFGAEPDIHDVNNRALLNKYKKVLKSIPINRSKGQFKGKTIHQLAEIEHNEKTMAVETSNKYLMYISSLLKYASEREYINKSQGYKLKDKNKVKARSQNDRFTEDELVALFGSLKKKFADQKQERFWIPLISLFTSCRLNEVCQLTARDIRKEQGVWVFDVTNETDDGEVSDKSIKSASGHRVLPIHTKLIDLGLLDYIQSRPATANENVWGLKYSGEKNKYGRSVGRTFSKHRKELFNPPPRTKTFHSLRHTFATFFNQVEGVKGELVEYFDGHAGDSETFKRYVKYDDYKWLRKQINKLLFPPKAEQMFQKWISERNKK